MRLPWTGWPEFHVRAPAREADAHGRWGGDDGVGASAWDDGGRRFADQAAECQAHGGWAEVPPVGVPGLCDGEFWNQVEKTLRRYGGSLGRLFQVRARREDIFQRERDRRPDTWHTDWRDLRPSTVRRALGCLIGEPPPAIVPS